MGDEELSASIGGYDRLGAAVGDEGAQIVAIVCFVGDDAAGGHAGEKLGRGGDVAVLAGGEDETEGSAAGIGEGVDLGGQSASGTPQSLIPRPPFPFAACWWTRTKVVSSIRYWCGMDNSYAQKKIF